MPSWQEKESVQNWRKLRDLLRCLAKGLAITLENRYNKNDPVREHCEELVMNHAQYDQETGKPLDQSYLECGLPDDLRASIQEMQKSWAIIDSGSRDPHWDIYWCNLNADINSAEVERIISPERAWYLREKYLRMERE